MNRLAPCYLVVNTLLGDVGPLHGSAFISDLGEWFSTVLMLNGRLVMFSSLVLLHPSFWEGLER